MKELIAAIVLAFIFISLVSAAIAYVVIRTVAEAFGAVLSQINGGK